MCTLEGLRPAGSPAETWIDTLPWCACNARVAARAHPSIHTAERFWVQADGSIEGGHAEVASTEGFTRGTCGSHARLQCELLL